MNKTAIKNFAVWARVTLINAVTQMAFEYDVTENGTNDPAQESVNGRTLTPTEKSQRAQLISNIRLNGFMQTMEEAAYTWFNRFIALRFMEVNNYLPSHTRIFSDESGAFKPEVLSDAVNLELDGLDRELVLELLENQENERLYKYIIITQCNALNEGLPEMFEQIGGWTELLFPRNLLREDSVIAHMVGDIPEDDWKDQVQIIGWLYQYYNTEPKDKVFADLKKNIKISAAAIPAATQLFTPDWIVRYMVENSLGRLWVEGHGKPENADWKYYLEEAEQEEQVKAELEKLRAEYKDIKPEQIRFLDPCMGSGHILVYAFDVLMDIYTACGWSERDAAKSILRHNLYGLDIDRRAYQLAYFAVMMKARQYNRRILSPENQPNLANFADVMGVEREMLSGSIRRFAEQFEFADTYGSLMTVTAPADIDTAVSDYLPTFGLNMRQLDMMMKIHNILGQKYDVVCTNPPYMGIGNMDGVLVDYLKEKYPETKTDFFAVFMEHSLEIINYHGLISMVTPQSWMFLSSYCYLRNLLINNGHFDNLINLGIHAFDNGFGTATWVYSSGKSYEFNGTYISLDKYGTSEEKENNILNKKNYHFQRLSLYSKLPNSVFAFWCSKAMAKIFEVCPLVKEHYVLESGIKTGKNELFLRFWHEISQDSICNGEINAKSLSDSAIKWFKCNKAGGYQKWFGSYEYVIKMGSHGAYLKAKVDKNVLRLRDESNYGKSALTWPHIGDVRYSCKYLPPEILNDVAADAIYTLSGEPDFALIGFFNSIVFNAMLNMINPTVNYPLDSIGNAHFMRLNESHRDIIEPLVKENIELSKQDWDAFETSWDFDQHPLI